MQIQGMQGTQREFVAGVKENEVNTADAQQQSQPEAEVSWEQKESYQPSEEALLRFYYEQMKSEQENAVANKEEQVDIAKLMKIARSIMRGKQVPSKDESYLVKHNLSLYMAAKNIGSLKEPSGKEKSVLSGSSTCSAKESVNSQTDESCVAENAVSETVELERNYGTGFTYSSSGTKRATKAKKKYMKFRYNFKTISSQIVKAKTSMGARQAAGRARRQTTDLRRKLVSGEYDNTYVRIALTHAEAIERVAKKKVRHLLEEERAKRGGPCSGDNDKFDKEEQQRLDEQAYREMQNNFHGDETEAETNGENLEELFATAVEQSAPASEISIDMDELMMEFEELMKESMEESMEEVAGMDDLTEELVVETDTDMDPEDLKLLKIKHRTKEQQEIAIADARYLRAFFEQLQKDRQQMSAAISQMAEAAAADMPVIQTADIRGGRAAAPEAAIASAATAEPAKTDVTPEIAAPAEDMKASTGGNISSPSISIDGSSFDVSI